MRSGRRSDSKVPEVKRDCAGSHQAVPTEYEHAIFPGSKLSCCCGSTRTENIQSAFELLVKKWTSHVSFHSLNKILNTQFLVVFKHIILLVCLLEIF